MNSPATTNGKSRKGRPMTEKQPKQKRIEADPGERIVEDDSGVKHLNSADARAGFAEAVAMVRYGGHRIVIDMYGKPVAALVSMDDYANLALWSKKEARS